MLGIPVLALLATDQQWIAAASRDASLWLLVAPILAALISCLQMSQKPLAWSLHVFAMVVLCTVRSSLPQGPGNGALLATSLLLVALALRRALALRMEQERFQ